MKNLFDRARLICFLLFVASLIGTVTIWSHFHASGVYPKALIWWAIVTVMFEGFSGVFNSLYLNAKKNEENKGERSKDRN